MARRYAHATNASLIKVPFRAKAVHLAVLTCDMVRALPGHYVGFRLMSSFFFDLTGGPVAEIDLPSVQQACSWIVRSCPIGQILRTSPCLTLNIRAIVVSCEHRR